MRRVLKFSAALAAVPMLIAVGLAPADADTTAAPDVVPAGVAAAGTQAPVLADTQNAFTTVDASGVQVLATTATFQVTYTGFSTAAKTAFQRAVANWSSRISSPVPIKINAKFTPLGTGVLGSGGPVQYWRDFAGAQASTWYPVALASKKVGYDISGDVADINVTLNSTFPSWYLGTSTVPAGKWDLTSVSANAIGHGLGFLGSMTKSGGSGTFGQSGTAMPTRYDKLAVNGAGKLLVSYPRGSTALGTVLTSNNVWWNGAKAKAANKGDRPKLNAAVTWSANSFSNLDEYRYPAGHAESLMTPVVRPAEAARVPGPVTLAMLKDMGW